MGWMCLMIIVQTIKFRGLIHDNAGRKRFSKFCKDDRFFVLMLYNFENAALHKYVVQKGKSLQRVNHLKSVSKIQFLTFCRIILQTLPGILISV